MTISRFSVGQDNFICQSGHKTWWLGLKFGWTNFSIEYVNSFAISNHFEEEVYFETWNLLTVAFYAPKSEKNDIFWCGKVDEEKHWTNLKDKFWGIFLEEIDKVGIKGIFVISPVSRRFEGLKVEWLEGMSVPKVIISKASITFPTSWAPQWGVRS